MAPDVDGNSWVTPLDVLILISWINREGIGSLEGISPDVGNGSFSFVDVNGDDLASPIDVLIVISYINETPSPDLRLPRAKGPPTESTRIGLSWTPLSRTGSLAAKRDAVFHQYANSPGPDDDDDLLELLAKEAQPNDRVFENLV